MIANNQQVIDHKRNKMKKKIIKDLFCFQCDLQFDKKSIYDMHLSIVHNYRHRTVIEIKSEPEEMELPIEYGIIPSKITEDYQEITTFP